MIKCNLYSDGTSFVEFNCKAQPYAKGFDTHNAGIDAALMLADQREVNIAYWREAPSNSAA